MRAFLGYAISSLMHLFLKLIIFVFTLNFSLSFNTTAQEKSQAELWQEAFSSAIEMVRANPQLIPRLSPNTKLGEASYTEIEIPKNPNPVKGINGAYFYGFRFKAPETAARLRLVWSISPIPQGISSWSIRPMNPKNLLNGFTHWAPFTFPEDLHAYGIPPKGQLWFQELYTQGEALDENNKKVRVYSTIDSDGNAVKRMPGLIPGEDYFIIFTLSASGSNGQKTNVSLNIFGDSESMLHMMFSKKESPEDWKQRQ